MSVKWDRNFPRQTLQPALVEAFERYGESYVRSAKRSISKPFPPPSAPGEPPRRRTGELRKSIRHVVLSRPGVVTFQAGSDLRYSVFLEFGTPPRMAARPFLRPTLRRTIPRLNKELKAVNLPNVSKGFRTAVAR